MNLDDATLSRLNQLCDASDGPWALVPSTETTSGTIVLHDRHGVSIADLYTEGPACPCDELIALAPTVIADLIGEVRRLRAAYDDALRRAMGHAYATAMAEGGEDIQAQELARERKDHAETRAIVRAVEQAIADGGDSMRQLSSVRAALHAGRES